MQKSVCTVLDSRFITHVSAEGGRWKPIVVQFATYSPQVWSFKASSVLAMEVGNVLCQAVNLLEFRIFAYS